MDPGPSSQSTTTTTAHLPSDVQVEHIELQVLPAALPTTVTIARPASSSGNVDPEDPEGNELVDDSFPLGVKLTAYRLLNLVVILAFGLAKFILSLKGQYLAPAGLEWFAGSVFAAL
jgi:hypothetical protein